MLTCECLGYKIGEHTPIVYNFDGRAGDNSGFGVPMARDCKADTHKSISYDGGGWDYILEKKNMFV